MVDITIIIEGGVLPHPNVDAQTVDNSNALRQGFHQLFTQLLAEEDFNLVVKTGGPDRNAAKMFNEETLDNEDVILLVDMEGPTEDKPKRIKDLGLDSYLNSLFFMIQKMEAWILSQPDKIELFGSNQGYDRRRPELDLIENNTLIKNEHPSALNNPDKRLDTLLNQYFGKVRRNGKVRGVKYGKLKDAPSLLMLLKAEELKSTFEDFDKMVLYIQEKKN